MESVDSDLKRSLETSKSSPLSDPQHHSPDLFTSSLAPCLWVLPLHPTPQPPHTVSVLPPVNLLKTNSESGVPFLPTSFDSSFQVRSAPSATG